jgi:hypothetical protein
MKKVCLAMVLVVFMFSGFIYGGKYGEAVPLVNEMLKTFETFIHRLDKAESGKAVAECLDNYSNVIRKIGPKLKKLMEKYPELKDEKFHPEELKPQLAKIEKLSSRLVGLFGKIQKYVDDPAVQPAYKHWMETMKIMDDSSEKEKTEE